jgi:RNA polymerase sigma factor (sigma-70 family)
MLEAPTTNAQWLTAAKDLTDNKTWEQLLSVYRAPILNHCSKSGLTPQESEEIVQEALSQLAIQIGKDGARWERTSLRAWLTDVVNRYIIDAVKNSPQAQLPPKVLALVQQWMEPTDGNQPSSEERIEAESHLWTLSLNRARSQVAPQHWQIFDAYAIQGLSSKEVAKLFNTSHFNVRLIAHRIKKVVRQAYNQLLSEEIHLPSP